MYKTKATALKHLAAGENFKKKVFDLFRGDKEVVLAAVSNSVISLQYASPTLLNDKEFILAAISNNAFSLVFASLELKADKEVVLAAVSNDSRVLWCASDEIRELVDHSSNPAAKLQSLIEKNKLESRHHINSQKTIPDAL